MAEPAAPPLRWRHMLLVFGAITMDMVFPLRRTPRPGDTLWSGGSRLEPGGHGANQALAARQDGQRVWLAGAVGQDAMGDSVLALLKAARINIDLITRHDAPTGRSAITVDTEGYTTVVTDSGANLLATAAQVPDWALRRGSVLLVQMETGAQEVGRLIARARAAAMRIVLDLSPARPLAPEALQAVDVLVGNSHQLAWAGEHIGTGNNPASLQAALGIPAVVRMMGAQGAEAFSREGGFRHMPAHPVRMRDTTGAGDCFAGVLAAALAQGARLDTALRRAAVAAALSSTRLGAWGSMPATQEIDEALVCAPQVTHEQEEVPD